MLPERFSRSFFLSFFISSIQRNMSNQNQQVSLDGGSFSPAERETFSEQLKTQSDEFFVSNKDERFNIPAFVRLPTIFMGTSLFGFISGCYEGYSKASLRYLAENSHRLPRNVKGWYFYHKRKNYYCLKDGMVEGFKYSWKISFLITGYFSFEAFLDTVREKRDFLNSVVSTTLFFYAYSHYVKLSKFQKINMVKRGFKFGLASGLVQDFLIYRRNGNVWYLNAIGIKPLNYYFPSMNEEEGNNEISLDNNNSNNDNQRLSA